MARTHLVSADISILSLSYLLLFATTVSLGIAATITPSASLKRTQTLPASGTGLSYAQACNSLSWTFQEELADWQAEKGHQSFSTITLTSVLTSHNYTHSQFYTLCDGIPRFNGTMTPTATHKSTTSDTLISEIYSSYTKPSPACTIDDKDCSALWSSYKSIRSHSPTAVVESPILCPDCGKCTITGGTVRILYAPIPSTISRNLCTDAPDNTTRPPVSRSGHAIYSGTTLDLNSAYISFENVHAQDGCSRRTGSSHPGALLSLPSTDLSSFRITYTADEDNGALAIDTPIGWTYLTYSFSYADLNHPTPWSAYVGQDSCRQPFGTCTTIADGEYRPRLAFPEQVRKLDAAWKD